MGKVYRDGQAAPDPTEDELEALAAAEGVHLSIEGEVQPLAVAVADLFDILTLAAQHEPEKQITYKLEIYEVEETGEG